MHVDWRWIKQRPHFLAEGLSRSYDIFVLYRVNPRRKHLLKNISNLRRLPFFTLPRSWGAILERIDAYINRYWLSCIGMLFKPDIVWLTFPTLYNYLPHRLCNLPLIYDCMDDVKEFFSGGYLESRAVSSESKLVKNANVVICSSQNLCRLMEKRYGGKYTLIRNGFHKEFVLNRINTTWVKDEQKLFTEIAYIGTISKWLDYDSLLFCLDKNDKLRFHLIGVADHKPVQHKRLLYHGIVEHERLPEYVEKFDAFIMPFVLNPLIESVDPIKLYEYLIFGKEIISIFYPEIERFAPYLRFYRTREELCALLEKLVNGTLPTKIHRDGILQFLNENTWDKRMESVNEIVKDLADIL